MATTHRAVIYCRVSDPGEDDGFGMDAQEAECRAYAARHGWQVVAVYREWHTGTELFERPELTTVREAVRARAVDVVLVDRLDRLTRDSNHRGFLRTEADYAGVQIASARETLDPTPIGRFVEFAYGWQGETERQKNVENMARGKRTKVARGTPIGQGKPSYGLAWRRDERGTIVGWQEEASTAANVRRIFADYDAGKSLRQLAKDLQADGILPPYHKRTGTRHWTVGTLRIILTQRLYLGEAAAYRHECWKERDAETGKMKRRNRIRPAAEQTPLPAGVAPVLIDRALFDRVQERLAGNQARAVEWRSTRNPEVGILRRGGAFCGTCGNKLVVVNTTYGPIYKCTGQKYLGCPVAVGITVARADAAVWDYLTAVLSDEDRVRRHLEALRRDDPTADDLATVDRQRAELERRQANFAAVIAAMTNPDGAGAIAAQLDLLGTQLQANARTRQDIVARQATWQREQAHLADVLTYCRRVAEDMAVVTAWADRRAITRALRVRFELFPADATPRWIATSDVVPDVLTSEGADLTSTCRRSGRAAATGCWSARASAQKH